MTTPIHSSSPDAFSGYMAPAGMPIGQTPSTQVGSVSSLATTPKKGGAVALTLSSSLIIPGKLLRGVASLTVKLLTIPATVAGVAAAIAVGIPLATIGGIGGLGVALIRHILGVRNEDFLENIFLELAVKGATMGAASGVAAGLVLFGICQTPAILLDMLSGGLLTLGGQPEESVSGKLLDSLLWNRLNKK